MLHTTSRLNYRTNNCSFVLEFLNRTDTFQVFFLLQPAVAVGKAAAISCSFLSCTVDEMMCVQNSKTVFPVVVGQVFCVRICSTVKRVSALSVFSLARTC